MGGADRTKKYTVWPTKAPSATRVNEKVMEKWRNEEGFLLLLLVLFLINWVSMLQDKGRIWKDWEMSRLAMHNVKSPQKQYTIMLKNKWVKELNLKHNGMHHQ